MEGGYINVQAATRGHSPLPEETVTHNTSREKDKRSSTLKRFPGECDILDSLLMCVQFYLLQLFGGREGCLHPIITHKWCLLIFDGCF